MPLNTRRVESRGGSLVVMVTYSWPSCHEFEPSDIEGVSLRGFPNPISGALRCGRRRTWSFFILFERRDGHWLRREDPGGVPEILLPLGVEDFFGMDESLEAVICFVNVLKKECLHNTVNFPGPVICSGSSETNEKLHNQLPDHGSSVWFVARF
ncbi:hypothetical protein TNCV_4389151 [Trichonephila clavipes]|nr:hypothetical protein TNCV_4389151 [Trichonephila clavipes]